MKICAFCDNEAVFVVVRSGAPLCEHCALVYEAGQTNPDGDVVSLEVTNEENKDS